MQCSYVLRKVSKMMPYTSEIGGVSVRVVEEELYAAVILVLGGVLAIVILREVEEDSRLCIWE